MSARGEAQQQLTAAYSDTNTSPNVYNNKTVCLQKLKVYFSFW